MCTDSTVTAARLLAELGMDSTTKAAYLEELRFAKRQQWAVTLAIIAFIAGAFHMAHSAKPLLGSGEKHAVAGFILFVVVGGSWLLYKLQGHLRNTRLLIDPDDTSPWRDAYIAIAMVVVLIISAIAVCYSLWRV